MRYKELKSKDLDIYYNIHTYEIYYNLKYIINNIKYFFKKIYIFKFIKKYFLKMYLKVLINKLIYICILLYNIYMHY